MIAQVEQEDHEGEREDVLTLFCGVDRVGEGLFGNVVSAHDMVNVE